MAALDPHGLARNTTSLQADGAGAVLDEPEFGHLRNVARDYFLGPLEYGNKGIPPVLGLWDDRLA